MLSRAEMLYYTPPVATPMQPGLARTSQSTTPTRLFVTDTVYDRNHHLVGTIVTLKTDTTVNNGKPWRTTTDGTYVTGHPVNNVGSYRQVIGLVAGREDIFYYGELELIHSDGELVGGKLSTSLNSLNEYADPTTANRRGSSVHLTSWVEAAPWAGELMPRPTDTAATIRAKAELAKERWLFNRAVGDMAQEGFQRGWEGNLEELQNDLTYLPKVQVGAVVEGTVLIPTGQQVRRTDLDTDAAAAAAKVEALSTRRNTGDFGRQMVPMEISIPVHTEMRPEDLHSATGQQVVANNLRSVLGIPPNQLGHLTTRPFVTRLSSLV